MNFTAKLQSALELLEAKKMIGDDKKPFLEKNILGWQVLMYDDIHAETGHLYDKTKIRLPRIKEKLDLFLRDHYSKTTPDNPSLCRVVATLSQARGQENPARFKILTGDEAADSVRKKRIADWCVTVSYHPTAQGNVFTNDKGRQGGEVGGDRNVFILVKSTCRYCKFHVATQFHISAFRCSDCIGCMRSCAGPFICRDRRTSAIESSHAKQSEHVSISV
jgi:hypothetical protein